MGKRSRSDDDSDDDSDHTMKKVKKSHKHKKKHKKHKDKDKEKEKKKKDKKTKKKHESSDSESSESEREPEPGAEPEIHIPTEKGILSAVSVLSSLISSSPSSLKDIQYLFFKLSKGQIVMIDELKDTSVLQKLKQIFYELGMIRIPQARGYVKSIHTPSLMETLEPCFREAEFKEAQAKQTKEEPSTSTVEVEATVTMPTPAPSGPREIGPYIPTEAERQAALQALAEEEDVVGPKIPSMMTEEEKIYHDLIKQQREDDALMREMGQDMLKSREEWMTAVPDEKPMSGLDGLDQKSRKFLMTERQSRGDTSSWTDTPEQKQRKAMEAQILAQAKAKTNKRGASGGADDDDDDTKHALSANATAAAAQAAHERAMAKIKQPAEGKSLVTMHNEARAAAAAKGKGKGGHLFGDQLLFDRDKEFSMRKIKDHKQVKTEINAAQSLMDNFH